MRSNRWPFSRTRQAPTFAHIARPHTSRTSQFEGGVQNVECLQDREIVRRDPARLLRVSLHRGNLSLLCLCSCADAIVLRLSLKIDRPTGSGAAGLPASRDLAVQRPPFEQACADARAVRAAKTAFEFTHRQLELLRRIGLGRGG
jgi:hypothetical protein